MKAKALAAGAAVVVATVVVVAGLAWACTNFIQVGAVAPGSLSSTVLVEGRGAAAGAAVEVRWNGVEGPVIGRAPADAEGAFKVEATIPDLPSGLYTLVVADGVNPVGRAAYEIGNASLSADALLASASSAPIDSARVGLTVLALGLVALASGTAVAAVSRRRVLAPAAAGLSPTA